ncbi:DUF3488 domain-containing protein [Trichocoleus sp. FACHB-832]|uniref:transglutaminase TgpA family protein n=1 Tax=Trichocoleus sp. FACHB-832 TaxID=2692875 RepID=UPI0016858E71|nr:DUF3488 and DUF4129 domain-containing transglutaminase family protein [Trichocoleus sp. FACHB-832]MBD1908086.1 DUF3488 domain-containing protein [Trichocoleus sp. FACHB-832]
MTNSVLHRVRQRLETTPKPETEESILLRVLVQALVVVGIIATDVAAETQISLWAVPLSLVGATWSYYRRRDRNVPVKFLIAIGMVVALTVFLRNLFGALNDTRLVLAELLIHLQVLHSFDLPRRKDLGYSMVIGLILLGVAGTVSQTLTFAPILLLFLGVALPVLVLDYRSRLGLLEGKSKKTKVKKNPQEIKNTFKFYFLLFTLIVGLGLTIFAVMPRFPGYQLQTFPVSGPQGLEQQNFSSNGRAIVNPGYARQGKQGSGGGGGQNQERGAGQMDDTFYYGFSSKINQNLRGEMKPKVVMRVRSQAEGFWRVLALDRYTGQGWEISRDKQTQTVQRPAWSYRFFLPRQVIFTGKTKQVIQSYTIVSELPNLIPALSYPKELYFPTQEVAVDTESGLRAPTGLGEGFTYTVISEVPVRDRALLAKTSTNYSERIRNYYLQVPPEISDKVRQLTEEILAKSRKPITSPYEKALYLAQYLKQNYTIPQDPFGLPFLDENEDLVEAFLFKQKGGYPDHFSTVLTIMLRSVGIPSRLVAGFSPGEFNPFTGFYVVRNTDAYAMTEVYFPNYGWFAFDPIPGNPLIPPSVEEDQTFSVLRQFWKWVAGWLPSPVSSWLNNVFGAIIIWLIGAIIWLWALLSNGWVGLFTGIILAICLGFLGWLAWNRLQALRYRLWLGKLPPMESIYQQMLKELSVQGYAKHPAHTPLEYAYQARQHHSPDKAEVINEISQAYVQWRYGGETPNLKQLRSRLQSLKKSQMKKVWEKRSRLKLVKQ